MDKFKCKKCNGTGWDPDHKLTYVDGTMVMITCDHCRGYGVLDWIENIRGKKNRRFEYKEAYLCSSEETMNKDPRKKPLWDSGSLGGLMATIEECKELDRKDEEMGRRRTLEKVDDIFIRYNDDEATYTFVYDKLLRWFKKNQLFSGESIMQSDSASLEGPELLAELADEIFEFEVEYDDDV